VLARSGCDVVVCYHKDEKGAQETAKTVQAAGRQALVVQVDTGDEKAVQNLFDKALKQFNRLDIFVNNAGVYEGSP
jgi:glucose 1-dehydrogenase